MKPPGKGRPADDLMLFPAHVLEDMAKKKGHKRMGHAGWPGNGPAGETCGSCKNYTRREWNGRTYRKCGLTEANWNNSYGTDIRKRDPACEFWSASPPRPQPLPECHRFPGRECPGGCQYILGPHECAHEIAEKARGLVSPKPGAFPDRYNS